MPDILTLGLGLDAFTGERIVFALALAAAREHPWRYRLPDEVRRWYEEQFATLHRWGCGGPVVGALARALRLDEEARRGTD